MANGEVVYKKGLPKEVVKIITITAVAAIIIGLLLAFLQTPATQTQISQQSPQPGPQTTPPVVQTPQKTPEPAKTGALELGAKNLRELEYNRDKIDELNLKKKLVRVSGTILSAERRPGYYVIFVAPPAEEENGVSYAASVRIPLTASQPNETIEALMPYAQERVRAAEIYPESLGGGRFADSPYFANVTKVTVEGKIVYTPGWAGLSLVGVKIYSIGG